MSLNTCFYRLLAASFNVIFIIIGIYLRIYQLLPLFHHILLRLVRVPQDLGLYPIVGEGPHLDVVSFIFFVGQV